MCLMGFLEWLYEWKGWYVCTQCCKPSISISILFEFQHLNGVNFSEESPWDRSGKAEPCLHRTEPCVFITLLYCACHDVSNSCFSLFSMTTPVVTKWMAQKRYSVGLLGLQLSCLYTCVILKCENASKGFCVVRRRITHFDPIFHWKLNLLSLETLLSLCIGHFSCY